MSRKEMRQKLEHDLFERYTDVIKYFVDKYKGKVMDGVHDEGCLRQESFRILCKAIRRYDFRSVMFKTYLSKCLDNHFKNMIRSWVRDRKVLVHNISEWDSLAANVSGDHDPEAECIANDLISKVAASLKDFDKLVFACMIDPPYQQNGKPRADDIACHLAVHPKKIIRSMQQIKEQVTTFVSSV